MNHKEHYQEKLKERLASLQTDVDRLVTKADKAEANIRLEYYTKIQQLVQKQHHANSRLHELQEASDDAWEELKTGVDIAWNNLSKAVKNASHHFK